MILERIEKGWAGKPGFSSFNAVQKLRGPSDYIQFLQGQLQRIYGFW
jgi:hypothetical protein